MRVVGLSPTNVIAVVRVFVLWRHRVESPRMGDTNASVHEHLTADAHHRGDSFPSAKVSRKPNHPRLGGLNGDCEVAGSLIVVVAGDIDRSLCGWNKGEQSKPHD